MRSWLEKIGGGCARLINLFVGLCRLLFVVCLNSSYVYLLATAGSACAVCGYVALIMSINWGLIMFSVLSVHPPVRRSPRQLGHFQRLLTDPGSMRRNQIPIAFQILFERSVALVTYAI